MSRPANLGRGAILAAACVLLGGARAHAGEGDARDRSAALFREGVTAGKAGDYARAEVAFRTAYFLSPTASTLRNWALTEMRLGKMVEALGHLKVALRFTEWTAAQRAIVQQNLDDAYAASGHLALTTADGAKVAIDGVLLEGTAPFEGPLDVGPGRRLVDVRLGAASAHAEVDAPAGRIVEVRVPIAPTTPDSPPVAPTVAAGSANAERPLGVAMAHPEPPRSTTWWTAPHAAAVGLATAAAIGAGLGLSFEVTSRAAGTDAGALRGTLTGQCAGPAVAPGCASLRDKIDAVHTDAVVADVAFAVAAASALGAAIAWAVARPHATPRTGSVRWTPLAAPGAAGLAGSF